MKDWIGLWKHKSLGILLLVLALAGCRAPALEQASLTTAVVTSASPSASPALSPLSSHAIRTPTGTPTLVPSATSTPTPSPTLLPSKTSTPSLTPTYAILRGKVMQRANCRYGPGAPYLYKYGLVVGSNLEVFGRNEAGTWILVRAIGGNNPCWVKASLMEVKGDVMSIEPTYIPLPQSPYYAPPTGVSAYRSGDQVTVTWNVISLRAGDETASPPYLVESWTCVGGQTIFTPTGSYVNHVTLVDEAGCSQPSFARVYIVEKHGYTRWIEVKFPEQ